MGEIRATARLENAGDILLRKAGKLGRRRIRALDVDAVVDTGAVMMLLPQDMAESLGLQSRGKVIVQLANDQKIELACAGGILLSVAGRQMSSDCLVSPPGCEPLLGQIVLERLDLISDAVKRTLTPRPESPFLPTLKMKGAAFGPLPAPGSRRLHGDDDRPLKTCAGRYRRTWSKGAPPTVYMGYGPLPIDEPRAGAAQGSGLGFQGREALFVIFQADLDFRQDRTVQGDGLVIVFRLLREGIYGAQNAADVVLGGHLGRHVVLDFPNVGLSLNHRDGDTVDLLV